jgi:pilus assembly protein CpaE
MILLASTSPTFEKRVRQAFDGNLNGDLRRADGASPEALVADAPDDLQLVAVGPDIPMDNAIGLAKAFDAMRPDVSVLFVASATPEMFAAAMQVGVRDVIAPEADDEELRLAFDRAIASSTQRQSQAPPADSHQPQRPLGRVVTVISPKGGAGKTTIATNLAVLLASAHPGEVVLADFDLQFGDVTDALGLSPTHSIADAARAPGRLDATTIKVFLTPRQSDLFVLCAPGSPAEGEEVHADPAGEMLQLLASEFPYVVVDTPAGLTEHTLAAIEQSTDLVLVCDLSRSSVRSTRRVIEALDAVGLVGPQRHLVLNRAGTKVGIADAEVAASLGMRIDVGVPSTRSVPLSMNQGIPIVEAEPKSAFSRNLLGLSARFAAIETPSQGLLKRRAR